MATYSDVINVKTTAREQMLDITGQVQKVAQASGISSGIALVASQHTTGGITVQEGADPDVQRDMLQHLRSLVPLESGFRHAEGNSDAHLKVALVGASQALPLAAGEIVLGTWQRIFFCDFDGPRQRKVMVTVVG
jgi:secondary thiamine-phosphate synthase enzyme